MKARLLIRTSPIPLIKGSAARFFLAFGPKTGYKTLKKREEISPVETGQEIIVCVFFGSDRAFDAESFFFGVFSLQTKKPETDTAKIRQTTKQ